MDPRSQRVLADHPLAFWRLDEASGPVARDSSGNGHDGQYEGLVAYWLDGPAGGSVGRFMPNNAVHFVDGAITRRLQLGGSWTIEFWMWNGIQEPEKTSAGEIVSLSPDVGVSSPRWTLSLGGRGERTGQLVLKSGRESKVGFRTMAPKTWHHVAWTFAAGKSRVLLDGREDLTLELASDEMAGAATNLRFGGGSGEVPFQGRLDDIAVYSRGLKDSEISGHLLKE